MFTPLQWIFLFIFLLFSLLIYFTLHNQPVISVSCFAGSFAIGCLNNRKKMCRFFIFDKSTQDFTDR